MQEIKQEIKQKVDLIDCLSFTIALFTILIFIILFVFHSKYFLYLDILIALFYTGPLKLFGI